jgi:hypothetical protein
LVFFLLFFLTGASPLEKKGSCALEDAVVNVVVLVVVVPTPPLKS